MKMSWPSWRPVAWLCAIAWSLGTGLVTCAQAHDRQDHDRARMALKAGEVLPLQDVLAQVQRSHPGNVLEVELERKDGRWIYELKMLQSGGRLLRLDVDAKTGSVLRSRARPAPGSVPAASTPRGGP
jgi:uncharacterized iron-regulated membrane protein